MPLKQGMHIDTEEKEYRAWPAINYSSLSDFNVSQDHALIEKPAKSFFELGNAFELLIEDRAKGTAKFSKRFFLAKAPGDMPEGLAVWIKSGEDLKSKYKYNKDESFSKRFERKHIWLDECQANLGRMPIGTDQMEMLTTMVNNFMAMQPFADQGQEATLENILSVADFQVPIIWYVGKMRKKGLIDCMVITEKAIYVFDIKTAADIDRFMWMLKSKYWIQEAHYTTGLKAIFPSKEIVWRFLVSSKTKPYISQPFQVDPYSLSEYGMNEYSNLCDRYQVWIDEGRPPKGWKELEAVRLFFK